jgi:ABC-2 type transport system permease protein
MAAASDLRLFFSWTVARLLILRRTPRASFFTFIFPVVLFVLIGGVNTGTIKVAPGVHIDATQYFAPSLAIFTLLTSCYTTTIFTIANSKEKGILKRVRGTPLPPVVYIASMVTSAIIAAIAGVTLMFLVAVIGFNFQIYAERLPAALVTLVLGGATLAALGMFVSTFVKKADAAPAVANITMFPILFLSGIFFPTTNFPGWLKQVVDIFPVSHLVHAFTYCFSPFATGSGFIGKDLGVLVIWFVAASVLAIRRFRFESQGNE